MIIKRKKSLQIKLGTVHIGGDAQISVQSMTNTQTQQIDSTVKQILRLENAGCEIVRVAIPDQESAYALADIKKQINIPIIADIHFDYQLALMAIETGADGIRINPGNINSVLQLKQIVDCAKMHHIPIRIGVNAGSLEKNLIKKYHGVTPDAMVESAMNHIHQFEDMGFDLIKVSIKASDVNRTVCAYQKLSDLTNYPLHIGITEAGTLISGTVKSSLGIGMLLAQGIGDTLRVSLTRDPVEEIRVGYEILKALGIRQRGPEIISCPTCGRCSINLFDIVEKIESQLINETFPLKIAIMGCIVNGPGEAKEADIGIAGGDGKGILFKKGKIVKKFDQNCLVDVLLFEIQQLKSKNI